MKMSLRWLCGAISVLLNISLVFGVLPTMIQTCNRNDPNLNACVTRSVELLRPALTSGDLGENFQIPELEPLFIDEILMKRGDFLANFNNLLVSGPSQFVLNNMQSNIANLSFDFDLGFPVLNFTGKYSLQLSIMFMDINGRGNIKGSFKNAKAKVRANGFIETIDGKDFVRFKLSVKIKMDSARFYMDNLFNGQSSHMNAFGNKIINEHHKIFVRELLPGLESSLSKIFTKIINNILETATLDEMFPE